MRKNVKAIAGCRRVTLLSNEVFLGLTCLSLSLALAFLCLCKLNKRERETLQEQLSRLNLLIRIQSTFSARCRWMNESKNEKRNEANDDDDGD